MALPDRFVMALTRWVQYWLLSGETEDTVEGRYTRRFPDLAISVFRTALRYARRALGIGSRVQRMDPSLPLSAALGRGSQPDPNVSVRLLFHWTDQSGHDYWNTIRVSAQWTDSVDDVIARGREALDRIAIRYGGAVQTSVEIVPAILFPSGEQL